jgi:hypothetical protein
MSLLDKAMESYIILNKTTVDDGYGGYVNTWTEGAKIQGAMVFNSSLQARVAEAQGVTSVYTFTTKKNINLNYHDVVRRVRDGKIFRVTSDGDDLFTPNSAGLNMRQVTCEEWVLPKEA